MEQVHRWKSEPWQRKEPGSRLTAKQRALESKSQRERSQMENKSTQKAYVVFPKYLYSLDMRHKFYVELNIPLRMEEIMERMQLAFPNCELKTRREK